MRAGSGPDALAPVPTTARTGDYRQRGVVVATRGLGDAAYVEVTVPAGS